MHSEMATISILKLYFMKSGQSISEFARELKALSAEERIELAEGATKAMKEEQAANSPV